jgi:hypothetical protein
MESQEFESLEERTARRLGDLLHLFSGCLNNAEHSDIERMIWAGEPVVAFECLCGTLSALRISVSRHVLTEIRQLGSELDADMTFCDGISEATDG